MRLPPYRLRVPDGVVPHAVLTGHCPRCGYAGSFKLAQYVSLDGTPYRLSFAMVCTHCNGLVLVDASRVIGPGGQVDAVYPSDARVFPYDDFDTVPGVLRAAVDETYRAVEAGAYTLAGLGCRVVLERLVQGLGYRDDPRPLEARLEALTAMHPDLVAPLANADVIRTVGNVAAHDAYHDLTKDEADAVIEFMEEVLRAVYIAPKKRERVAKAFEKKTDPAPPAKS